MNPLRVIFAPDYRAGLPYQKCLADALDGEGIKVDFLEHYKRVLPMSRGVDSIEGEFDLFHLHWPEAYFRSRSLLGRWGRRLRYPIDLKRVASRMPVVLTAHNLLPHNQAEHWRVFENVRFTAQVADLIFVHSDKAAQMVAETFDVPVERCCKVPYGDHALGMLPALDQGKSREELGLPEAGKEKVCLVFGTISPYKGTDEVIRYWCEKKPAARLVVVGPVISHEFARELEELAKGYESHVELRFSSHWLDETAIRKWLSASDCCIFNYRQIFTSGAAALARSFGLPLLIPSRLECADLDEPHPLVWRFDALEGGFGKCLGEALECSPDYEAAQAWREKTSWGNVATLTANAYRSLLSSV